MEEYLQIGVITTTHGVRGEVKVYPTTDPERFLSLDRVFLDTGKEKKELHVTGVRFFKQLAIVKFKGIDNINDIERYKGCSLYVTREDAIPLEEDEYYIADLQGMQMYTEDGELFGTLRDVMETGANDVYIVAVSYTHLDVYKRQARKRNGRAGTPSSELVDGAQDHD